MSSDADSPRQRTVAELLAAHGGDTAVTGRRARRRAAEDAADGAPAVVEAPPVSPAPANGNPANGNPASGNPTSGNPPTATLPTGTTATAARPPIATAAPSRRSTGPWRATAPPSATRSSTAARTRAATPTPPPTLPTATAQAAGNGGPVRGGDGPGAPYVNGDTYSGPRPGAPYVNGSADTTYSGPSPRAGGELPNGGRPDAGPYVNGNGGPRGSRGAPDPRTAQRNPRPGTGRPDDLAAAPESDAPFVNGGGYVESETTRSAPWTPDRSVLREPVPRDIDAPTVGQAEPWSPPSAEQARARPTEEMPRLRSDRTPMLDPGMTGPIDMHRLPPADDLDEGPSTAVGMAPVGAEEWHRERTGRRRAGRDAGPAVEPGDPFESFDDPPAGLDDEPGRRRTSPDVGKSPGQAWAAVVAQWIAGAIGGAALWVGFRFLWRDLPVVALAAAALVTVGLVLVVRALMHNDDRRTTLFAVLVGLLLTVSPALLVLLGR